MEDYDWLMYEQGSPWTDWSLSDVDVDSAYQVDVNASFDVVIADPLTLRILGGYKQDHWSWKDYGVRHIYSTDPATPGGFRDDVGEDHGETGIEYEQTFKIPYAGVEGELALAPWSLAAYLTYSPFVQATDRDRHLFRNIEFEEDFSGGDYIGAGIRCTYTFACRFYLAGAFDTQSIPEIIGDTTITDTTTGATGTSTDSAGIENQVSMISLAAGYTF